MGSSNTKQNKNESSDIYITYNNKNDHNLNDSTEHGSQLPYNFNINMLNYHNKYRTDHSSKSLKIHEELNQRANEYAKDIITSKNIQNKNYIIFQDDILGENILISNQEENEENICKKWYEEKKIYNYGLNTFQKGTNHFTQLIWEKTMYVGFGKYIDLENKKYCYVALYYPAGNIFGEFADNVHHSVNIKS